MVVSAQVGAKAAKIGYCPLKQEMSIMAPTLPRNGVSWRTLRRRMKEARENDIRWREGRMTMSCYVVSDALLQVQKEAYGMFLVENAMYSGEFAKRRKVGFLSLSKFEEEVVGMAIGILGGGERGAGTLTTGGTESIFLAVKAAREWAREKFPESRMPELVVPRSAHPAFNKAADYMGLRVRRVPLRSDFRADVKRMADAVSKDTVMIVGSAPSYPHGVIDPIVELGGVAEERGLWFHVDACVGGFLAPFVRKLGYSIPDFDFSVRGVSSISTDLHKYGYAAKGASVILFRDGALRKYSEFRFDEWPHGSYSTMTLCGSRTGGAIAAAWAVMNSLGESGYLKAAETIMGLKQRIANGVCNIDGLVVRGDPELGIMTIGSDQLDMGAVADGMSERGWAISRGKEPPSIHLTLNPVHKPVVEVFLSDLAAVAEEVRQGRLRSRGIEAVYVG